MTREADNRKDLEEAALHGYEICYINGCLKMEINDNTLEPHEVCGGGRGGGSDSRLCSVTV